MTITTKLMTAITAIMQSKTKQEITDNSNLAFTCAKELIMQNADRFETKPELLNHPGHFIKNLPDTKLREGEAINKVINNLKDTIEGCENRICITNDTEEIRQREMYILTYIKRIHDYVMYKQGYMTLAIKHQPKQILNLD